MRRAIVCGLMLVVIVGCGGEDEPAATGEVPDGGDDRGSQVVEVIAEDITFARDGFETPVGTVNFSYVNEGSIAHTLVIEDVDGFKLEVAAQGDTAEGAVQLEAGSYTLFCDVPGHRAAGMEATLEVG